MQKETHVSPENQLRTQKPELFTTEIWQTARFELTVQPPFKQTQFKHADSNIVGRSSIGWNSWNKLPITDKRRIKGHLIHNIIFNCIMHTDKKKMNVSYQASLVNRHIRRFTGLVSAVALLLYILLSSESFNHSCIGFMFVISLQPAWAFTVCALWSLCFCNWRGTLIATSWMVLNILIDWLIDWFGSCTIETRYEHQYDATGELCLSTNDFHHTLFLFMWFVVQARYL